MLAELMESLDRALAQYAWGLSSKRLRRRECVVLISALQHVMADTLGSVGVIISTLLINRYGWTGFDPIASIFIAVLIFASVVPLVTDAARLLCLDLGEGYERDVRTALAKVRTVHLYAAGFDLTVWLAQRSRGLVVICSGSLLAERSEHHCWLDSHPVGAIAIK